MAISIIIGSCGRGRRDAASAAPVEVMLGSQSRSSSSKAQALKQKKPQNRTILMHMLKRLRVRVLKEKGRSMQLC